MSYKTFTDCVDIVGTACQPFPGIKKYVSTGAVDTDHIVEDEVEIYNFDERPSRANLEVEVGDVLFAKMQATKKTLLIDNDLANNMYSTGFCAVRAKYGVLTNSCLYHLLTSNAFLNQKVKNCSGATQKAITNAGLSKIIIQIPDYSEQDNIARQLDLIMSIINMRKRELQLLDDLIKARFVEMFGDPEYNNMGWPVKKLNDLCNIGSSKRIYQGELTMDGIPFWRISDLVAKMDIGNVESSLFIPESRYEELKAQGLVPGPGDILVTSRGTLGRCYIISSDDCFYFQDGMISWLSRYVNEITPLYIRYLFDMHGIIKQIDSMQAGSTVAYLSIAMLKKLDIMLPDKALQEQFTTFVQQVDKSKFAVQKALEKAQLLFDSLMQQYFG